MSTDNLFAAFDEAISGMACGLSLVDVEWLPARGGARLVVTVARPEGRVSLEDCSRVTTVLDALVEDNSELGGPFVLEVSSPGLDRTLRRRHEYHIFRGRELSVWLNRPIDGRQEWSGILLDMRDEFVIIQAQGVNVSLPVEIITKAKLAYKFK